jgi:hypothetical protein
MPINLSKNITLIACLIFSHTAFAEVDMHFTELKIMITEKKPSLRYSIFNRGNTDAQCKLSFIDYNITTHGKLKIIKAGDAIPVNSAAKKLRLSPKNITIGPKSSQAVKILARGLRKFPDGELHSYLSISCRDKEVVLADGVNILPNYIFNIPTTVRKGELAVSANINNLKLSQNNNRTAVNFDITRTGNRSLYGDFTVTDEMGNEIGKIIGFSHYMQANVIPVSITLTSQPKGRVTVTFNEQELFGGNIQLTKSIL